MKLTPQQLATVLAALRMYSDHLSAGIVRTQYWMIANDGNRFMPLDSKAVDDLCLELNTSSDILK